MGSQFSVKLAESLIHYLSEINSSAYTESTTQDLAAKTAQTFTVAWSAIANYTGLANTSDGSHKFHGKDGMDVCLKIGLHFGLIDKRDLPSIRTEVLASTGPLRKRALTQAFLIPEALIKEGGTNRTARFEDFLPYIDPDKPLPTRFIDHVQRTDNYKALPPLSHGDCDTILRFLCFDLDILKSTSGKAVLKLLGRVFGVKQKDLNQYIEECKQNEGTESRTVSNQQLAQHLSAFPHTNDPVLSLLYETVMQTKENLPHTRADYARGRMWQTISPPPQSSASSTSSSSRRPSFASSSS